MVFANSSKSFYLCNIKLKQVNMEYIEKIIKGLTQLNMMIEGFKSYGQLPVVLAEYGRYGIRSVYMDSIVSFVRLGWLVCCCVC
jgi:hypothetical protein